MIELNCYKTLNYLGFRSIIRSVANEVRVSNPGPVEVGNLTRRHWNNLKEPSIIDLKKRVVKKKKKIRSKGPTNPASYSRSSGGTSGTSWSSGSSSRPEPPCGT